MTGARRYFRGGPIFDGERLLEDHALLLDDGIAMALAPEGDLAPSGAEVIDLAGDILSPGYVDLQVNGGDGLMFNDDQSVGTLRRMTAAHRRLGATTIFPTLITDTPERTRAAIEATVDALAAGVAGIGGLHLEGPHISLARKGAHDPSLIRPMEEADLAQLLDAAARLPDLMVTLAPESVTEDQVRALAEAGVIVSLGHTDADYATCMSYQKAGARCVTHLFNAMSQLGSREPGLVGAALQNPELATGLIADGVHVHPAAMRAALAAKNGRATVFLVSDAMAPAGTDQREFTLNGRTIRRENGRLLLGDGTLAGADLDLTTAIGVLVGNVGLALPEALAAATSIPAAVGRQGAGVGRILAGTRPDLIRLRGGAERGLRMVQTDPP